MKSLLLSVSAAFLALNAFAFGIEPQQHSWKPNLRLGSAIADNPWNGGENGRALSFGYYEFGSGALNHYLDTSSNVFSPFDNNYIAVGLDNITGTERHFADIVGSFQLIIPQKAAAGTADSLQLRMGGWHYTMSALGFDLIKGRTVALVIGPSLQWGNLKMKREVAGQSTRYTNPFVCVGGRAEFRLTFGKFFLGGRATYRYDFTHDLWKRKDDMMPVLPVYRNSGLAYFGYIGWIFEPKSETRTHKQRSPGQDRELLSLPGE
jgi:hypothetical protein